MSIFVDTSAWIALVDGRDEQHANAADALRRLASATERLVTHNYVVSETLAVVGRRLGMSSVREFVDHYLPLADIDWVMPAIHDQALAAYLDSPRRLSFVDHVSFALMRARGIDTAFAFDPDFEDLGFRLLGWT